MSGAISLGTVAALASAAVGAGSLAYGIKSGMDANDAQQAGLVKQNQAQQTAQASALSTERQSATAQGAANQAKPDITAILAHAATVGSGNSSTLLTGGTGVSNGGLNLGKTTPLGS